MKKKREGRDVLFIDASKEFKKDKAKNLMLPEHIEKIVTTYIERRDVEKFAHLATFEEIEENNFNLNIPRYVDTFEEEEPVNLAEVAEKISEAQSKLQTEMSAFIDMTKELHGEGIEDFLKSLGGGE